MRVGSHVTRDKERIMNSATRACRVLATVGLVVVAAACSSDGDDTTSQSVTQATPTTALDEPTTTEPPETSAPTVASTTAPVETTEPETIESSPTEAADDPTIQPEGTVVVPFHIVDPTFPVGWVCDDSIPGFDVAFTDEAGMRTVVEARYKTSFRLSTDNPNAVCAIESFEGQPALFVTAELFAPAAATYEKIEARYPFAFDVGSDTFETVFEMVSSEEAQAGLYLEAVQDAAPIPLDPSGVVGFPAVD
jgi:hypothetical protein